MKVAYCSDLHLEFGGRDFEFPEADIMLLVGDIFVIDDLSEPLSCTKIGMNVRDFLREVSLAYKQVIFVPGNHEFYDGNISTSSNKVIEYLKSEGIKNILFGDTGFLEIDDVSFIFATLWTDLKQNDPIVVGSGYMNDYTKIMITDPILESGGRYLTPADTMRIHDEHKKFIKEKLKQTKENVVVITHHAPNLISSHGIYRLDSTTYYYCCTDMDDLILDNPKIKYWIHGHLHTRKIYNIGDTVVTTNCRGYKIFEKATDSFEISVIEL